MQFGFAKNNAKGGGDIFSMSPTFRRAQSSKSLQKVLDQHQHHSPNAKTHAKNQPDQIPFPKTTYAEIAESESDSQVTRKATRKLSNELAQIRALIEADDDGNQYSLEDGRETKLEFAKLQTIEMATALTAFIGAAITVIAYDLEFMENEQELTTWLLWTILGSSIVTVFLNIFRYFQKLNFLKARNVISKKSTLLSTGDIWAVLIETGIILIQPYPGLQGKRVHEYDEFVGVDYFYHANDFFSLLVTLRLYFVVRFVLNSLIYRSPRSQRISDMYGADSSYLYACRCIMKMAPIIAVLIIMVVSIGVFGYMIRVCERPLSRDSTLAMQFNTYWNAMWCVILTMTTVGYGDIYARTMLGRFISFCMCIWGIFLVSLMVVTLTNILTMSAPEEKSLLILRRLELRKGVKKSAAYILTNIAKIGLIRKKRISAEKKNAATKEAVKDLKHHLTTFRLASREVKGLDDNTGAMEEVNRQIGFLREDVKTVIETQAELQKTVAMLMGGGVRSRYMDSRGNVPESKFNLHDFEEDVVIKQTK